MSSKLSGWIKIIGLTILLTILIIILLSPTDFFGIPPLVVEGIGAAIIAFVVGNISYISNNVSRFLLGFMLASVIMAIVFDPLIWKMLGLTFQNASSLSVEINGILGFVIVIYYIIGNGIKRKPASQH